MNIDAKETRFTVAYVIDTAASMIEELPLIQASLPRIREQLDDYKASSEGGAVNYMLVPFNDSGPETTVTTQDILTLTKHMQDLVGSGRADCINPSVGAMIKAAAQSERQGIINLYTDAPASDEERRSELVSIIDVKDLTINVFLTSNRRAECSQKRALNSKKELAEDSNIYHFLTAMTGGQTLEVTTNDLSSVGSIVASSFKPTTSTIFQQTGPAGTHTVKFQVDSTITEIQLTINGNNLRSIVLVTPQAAAQDALDLTVSLSSLSTYLASMNISDSRFYGMWQLSFTTSCSYKVYITGDSTMGFGYELHRSDKAATLGLRKVKDIVLQEEQLFLLINIDKTEGATVSKVAILSSDGSVWTLANSTAAGKGYFYASVKAPASFFQIQIAGVDDRGYQFTRISCTGVDTTDVQITLGPGQFNLPLLVLRPGENKTVTLLFSNFGPASTFQAKVASRSGSKDFTYYLYSTESATTQTVKLNKGEKKPLDLVIIAHHGIKATEANALSLIVTLSDSSSFERSNFINIEAIGTTLPPVNRTEITFVENIDVLGETLSYMILLTTSCVFLGLFTFLNR